MLRKRVRLHRQRLEHAHEEQPSCPFDVVTALMLIEQKKFAVNSLVSACRACTKLPMLSKEDTDFLWWRCRMLAATNVD